MILNIGGMANYKKETTINFIKLCTDLFKLDVNFPQDLKIVPVNQVWLLNQVLLNQKKLAL